MYADYENQGYRDYENQRYRDYEKTKMFKTLNSTLVGRLQKPSSIAVFTFNSAMNSGMSFVPCLTFITASENATNFSSARASQNRLRPAGTGNCKAAATTGDSFCKTVLLMTIGRPRLPQNQKQNQSKSINSNSNQ